MSHERNLRYLNNNRIVYRRFPITDKPTQENEMYMFYIEGTYECYELFRSAAKITTYRSLKWHLLVLWYLNPQLDQDQFLNLAQVIAHKENGFISFNISENLLSKIVYEVSMMELDEPPKNKLRKVIFKPFNNMTKEEKLKIVGKLIGRKTSITIEDIYEAMLAINDEGHAITIKGLSKALNCSTRTIHRKMNNELKHEKLILNEKI